MAAKRGPHHPRPQQLHPPIMFVLTSCGFEIVGDDIVAVCDEISCRSLSDSHSARRLCGAW